MFSLRPVLKPEQIFFISNNASAEELKYAIEMSGLYVDSLSQLELLGK